MKRKSWLKTFTVCALAVLMASCGSGRSSGARDGGGRTDDDTETGYYTPGDSGIGPEVTGRDRTEDVVSSTGSSFGLVDERDSSRYTGGTSGSTTAGESSTSGWHNQQLSIAQAGEHNDNEEFHYYIDFLRTYFDSGSAQYKRIIGTISNRIVVSVFDKNHNPLFHATVGYNGDSNTTYQDGEVFLYPDRFGTRQKITVAYQNMTTNVNINFTAFGRYEVLMNTTRSDAQKIPVDIVFVMDTTGSMGDEIDILRDTLYSIYMRIKQMNTGGALALRFGMVLYRDRGDEYVTKKFDLSSNLDSFQEFLYNVKAGGGGDTPEDLVSGLNETMKLSWDPNAIKLAFVITDASCHLASYDSWMSLANQFVGQDIKIFSIGASGLDIVGEWQLRMMAQLTKGSFIFMTYGETGESSGSGTVSDPGLVSHHTGANFNSRNLDDIVVDNVKREIYYLARQDIVAQVNNAYDYRQNEDEVYRRVDNAIRQIIKQTEARLSTNSTVLIVPPYTDTASLKPLAEHVSSVSEQIIIKEKFLRVVDRSNMQTITEEMMLKLAGMTETGDLSSITEADVILSGKLYFIANSSVLMVRLIDANNSEVLAAAMVKI